jgi:hypothetical protein
VTALPDQVDDCPVTFALLQVLARQFGDLVPPKPTRQEYCQHGSVTLSSESHRIWRLPQCISLLGR